MVQLLVYPSFASYKPDNLLKWHEKYTKRIAIIVIPLMIGQLMVTTAQFVYRQGFYEILSLILALAVWIVTFSQFVPLHQNISKEIEIDASVQKLIKKNWTRTAIWTLLFLLSLWFQLDPNNFCSDCT